MVKYKEPTNKETKVCDYSSSETDFFQKFFALSYIHVVIFLHKLLLWYKKDLVERLIVH